MGHVGIASRRLWVFRDHSITSGDVFFPAAKIKLNRERTEVESFQFDWFSRDANLFRFEIQLDVVKFIP
jgi:hypothetical protein